MWLIFSNQNIYLYTGVVASLRAKRSNPGFIALIKEAIKPYILKS